MRFEVSNSLSVEGDGPRCGWQKTAQQVEPGRLPTPIRTNQTDDLSLPDGNVDTVDGCQSTEVLGEIRCFQQGHTPLVVCLRVTPVWPPPPLRAQWQGWGWRRYPAA